MVQNRLSYTVFLLAGLLTPLAGADLRLGIIGTDTSHVPAFTASLNDLSSKDHVPGARIVAAFRGGSPDISESATRIDRFTHQIVDRYHVRLVPSIAQLCPVVDGLLLESVDGRQHLDQFRQALACGKPVFIDKPLAASLADAREIARLAHIAHVPWFSASSLRYSPIAALDTRSVTAAIVWAPGPTEPHQPLALSWYGIHGIEMLYTLLGPGCQAVSQVSTSASDTITAVWRDGRQGTIHLQRPYGHYGAVLFHQNQNVVIQSDIAVDYLPLVRQIVTFMQTRTPPVANTTTLEMFAFMEAAQRSASDRGRLTPLP